jgi:multisubunit Na+/H+ antiporter MnhF subunit
MDISPNPVATHHLPVFITAPGETDVLFWITAAVLVGGVLAAGVFFFWLHSLPERMVHNRVQFDLVAVLALLSLFTHIHAFWVAALLLALVKFPDFALPNFSSPLDSIAGSLEKIAQVAGEDTPPKKQVEASGPANRGSPTTQPAEPGKDVAKERAAL